MKAEFRNMCLSILGAAAVGMVAGCVAPSADSAVGKYDDA